MKCGTVRCPPGNDAAWRVHWPGRTIDLCDVCTAGALRIAEAMGFPLTVDMLVPQEAIAVVIVRPTPPGEKPS